MVRVAAMWRWPAMNLRPHNVAVPKITVKERGIGFHELGLRRIEDTVAQAFGKFLDNAGIVVVERTVRKCGCHVGQEPVLGEELTEAARFGVGGNYRKLSVAHESVRERKAFGSLPENARSRGSVCVSSGEFGTEASSVPG